MTHIPFRDYRIALPLAALLGYVDVIGLARSGLFVAFMAGDATRLSIALGADATPLAAAAGALLLAFLAGTMLAATPRELPRGDSALPLMLVAALLSIAAMLDALRPGPLGPLALSAAMGVAHGAAARAAASLAFTGLLVTLGTGAARTLRGGRDLRWTGNVLLIAAVFAGGIAATRADAAYGPRAILFAAAVAAGMSLVARFRRRGG